MTLQEQKDRIARAMVWALGDSKLEKAVRAFVDSHVDPPTLGQPTFAGLIEEAAKDNALQTHVEKLKEQEDLITEAIEDDPTGPSPGSAPSAAPLAVVLRKPGDETKNGVASLVAWAKDRTKAMSFDNFAAVLRLVEQPNWGDTDEEKKLARVGKRVRDSVVDAEIAEELKRCLHGSRAYDILSSLAQAFLGHACKQSVLPGSKLERYLDSRVTNYLMTLLDGMSADERETPFGDGVAKDAEKNFACLCPTELIWSYWHEEGMLVQTMNAISLRFQNVRSEAGERDPLAEFEIDPLRPLNNLLWGYIQDERNRLTVRRRAYEYDHHYGLRLIGKAVRDLRPADSRSRFLEAFHHLLLCCSRFYRDQTFTTIEPDASPVLHALRELHLVLAAGAHNQFGDLPWQARVEMLVQMWLLGRPQMREFLGGRVMVPYEEPWMGRVDAMKRLQGWVDPSISEFHRLARFGEQILLTVRYANWNRIVEEAAARTWATSLKTEIQAYVHSYRAVTGVDLSNDRSEQSDQDPRFLVPAHHLRRRIAQQSRSAADETDS